MINFLADQKDIDPTGAPDPEIVEMEHFSYASKHSCMHPCVSMITAPPGAMLGSDIYAHSLVRPPALQSASFGDGTGVLPTYVSASSGLS